MNLLTGDDSQQQFGSNASNYPPNWQYSPTPYSLPQQNVCYPSPPYPPPQQNAYYPPTQSTPNFAYEVLPLPYLPQNAPPLQPENNPKSNESGDTASKWTLEKDRQFVKSWINVSTNPLTGG